MYIIKKWFNIWNWIAEVNKQVLYLLKHDTQIGF